MTHLDQHYIDPRLVELYDIENVHGADTDFYLNLATELAAQTIIDLGCGTGMLTRELATEGRDVIGVDPSPAMLAIARRQAAGAPVQWIEGDAHSLDNREADLVLMTGNVAQIFLDDGEWAATLRDIHDALRTGGHLAFESRNPADHAWEGWNRAATYEQIDSPFGPMECWLTLISVEGSRVRFAGHNVFNATGEVVVAESELRFRSQEEIVASLTEAGFIVEQIYGGWQREPMSSTSRVMVFIARSR